MSRIYLCSWVCGMTAPIESHQHPSHYSFYFQFSYIFFFTLNQFFRYLYFLQQFSLHSPFISLLSSTLISLFLFPFIFLYFVTCYSHSLTINLSPSSILYILFLHPKKKKKKGSLSLSIFLVDFYFLFFLHLCFRLINFCVL